MAGRVLGAGAQWAAALGGQAFGTWLGSSRNSHECDCTCHFDASPDEALIGLLKGQLDRCGPEHLHGQPQFTPECPACAPCPPGRTGLEVFLALLLGLVLGAVLREVVGYYLRRPALVTVAPVHGGGADGQGAGEPGSGGQGPRLLRSRRQLLA